MSNCLNITNIMSKATGFLHTARLILITSDLAGGHKRVRILSVITMGGH